MNVIVPATAEHVEELARGIREDDLKEIRATTEMDAETVLMMSFCLSVECYTWLHNGRVAAVFGIAPDPEHAGCGCPWMIGTALIYSSRAFFLRKSRVFIERFNALYPLLENFVHPANAAAIRWLEWCGFSFGDPEPYGASDNLFLPFFKELPPCAP